VLEEDSASIFVNTEFFCCDCVAGRSDLLLYSSGLMYGYERLADMGLYYQAAIQSPERTLERLVGAIFLVAIKDKSIIGTICFYPGAYTNMEKCAWFDRTDVGRFG